MMCADVGTKADKFVMEDFLSAMVSYVRKAISIGNGQPLSLNPIVSLVGYWED